MFLPSNNAGIIMLSIIFDDTLYTHARHKHVYSFWRQRIFSRNQRISVENQPARGLSSETYPYSFFHLAAYANVTGLKKCEKCQMTVKHQSCPFNPGDRLISRTMIHCVTAERMKPLFFPNAFAFSTNFAWI